MAKAEKKNAKGGLKKAVEKLNNIVQDLTSLHVQTYTGSVQFAATTDQENKFDTVRKAVETAKGKGDVTLVAEAFYQFDGDSYNFLTSGAIPNGALEIHKAAVEAGIKTRQGLIELVKDALT